MGDMAMADDSEEEWFLLMICEMISECSALVRV
jgi:hypothetical protein